MQKNFQLGKHDVEHKSILSFFFFLNNRCYFQMTVFKGVGLFVLSKNDQLGWPV